MKVPHDSVYKLVLLFAGWVCFAGTCGSIQPKEDRERGEEASKYQATQLALCSNPHRFVGYWHKDGEMITFEADKVQFTSHYVDETKEEKARGVTWKSESWFEPTRYRVREGNKWSNWKTAAPNEKFGTFIIALESGRWVITPTSDKFTRGDCESFKKIPE